MSTDPTVAGSIERREELLTWLYRYLYRMDDMIRLGVQQNGDPLLHEACGASARTYAAAAQAAAAALAALPSEKPPGPEVWPAATATSPPYLNMGAEDGEAAK